jgi:ATP synthase protein I
VKGPESPWKALSLVSIIGADLAVCTLIGVWIGNKLDMYFTTAPWLMIVGVLLGIGAGMMTIIPIVKRFLGDQSDE